MSEANGCCRNLCLRDTGGPSSSVCLAELSRSIDSDFRGKTGLSMMLWRQIVNLSLSWLCAYQEQCGCIQHTRHLRSGRGEAGPLWAPFWASMAQCHGDTLGVCVSYFSHCCGKILMKQLEKGRKEGRVGLNSRFESPVHRAGERWWQKCAWSHGICSQKQSDTSWFSAHFLLFFLSGLACRTVFPPQ